ncbi:MAG TPA: hypothetical protein VEH50_08065 [Methylomirabilota bacterium]|nr:hypothetical protein [Methylomirabilota bacterium]
MSTDGKWYAVAPDLQVAGASAQLYVVICVTNIGRRPVQWMGWGAKLRKAKDGKSSFVMIPHMLPRVLKEGDWHSEYTDDLSLVDDNTKKITIWDSSGKCWYLSRRSLNELRKESKQFKLQA